MYFVQMGIHPGKEIPKKEIKSMWKSEIIRNQEVVIILWFPFLMIRMLH
jgi:hypothetical protein